MLVGTTYIPAMIVNSQNRLGILRAMTVPDRLYAKGRRYLLLAQKKSQTELRYLVQTGLLHFHQALQTEPRFAQWLEALRQLLQLLALYSQETWLIEHIDELCLRFVDQLSPQEEELQSLLNFLQNIQQIARAQPGLRSPLMQLAEGFFQRMGNCHPSWSGELLYLRGQMLLEQALLSIPICSYHLQAACHSFLQACNWQPTNPQTHMALAQTLLYQAQVSPDNPTIFYQLAWNSLCTALRLRNAALPRLEIPDIQIYALNQSLSMNQRLTLLQLMAARWFTYHQTPPPQRQFWLDQLQTARYRQFLSIHHRCILTQLQATSDLAAALEAYLHTWIEILSELPPSALLAWLKLLYALQKFLTQDKLALSLSELGKIFTECLTQGVASSETCMHHFLPLIQDLLQQMAPSELHPLAVGLYLPLIEMLMQGWLNEESYQMLWLDPLAECLGQVCQDPLLFKPLLHILENAWMALIACSTDEHLIIDSHEILLELLMHLPAEPFAQVLQSVRNLYTLLLSRHHCDYNLANLASYLHTLAEHRSGEEARALLLESCQTYAKACEIAHGDTELLMAWQNALRTLAEYDPEHAQELESEADGIYRQILEMMYERS